MVTDTIVPPVHPGEILLTEFLEPLAAPHQRRHGPAPSALLRHFGAVLDEPAGPLRPGDREGPSRDDARRDTPLSTAT
jgi:hypothetical protein